MDAVRISQEDPMYPAGLKACLGQSAPAAIWANGNLELLARKHKLAIFCSRKCPGNVIVKTYEYVRSLRDKGITAVGGFHSPLEQECLRLLLRGSSPVIVCPARSIQRMRPRPEWKEPLKTGRMLVVSPFEDGQNRMTSQLAEQRNLFAAALADEVFVIHASPGGKIEQLCRKIVSWGKPLLTFDHPENANLLALGATPVTG